MGKRVKEAHVPASTEGGSQSSMQVHRNKQRRAGGSDLRKIITRESLKSFTAEEYTTDDDERTAEDGPLVVVGGVVVVLLYKTLVKPNRRHELVV